MFQCDNSPSPTTLVSVGEGSERSHNVCEPGTMPAAKPSVRDAHGEGDPGCRSHLEIGDSAGSDLAPDAILHVRDHDVFDRAPGVLVLLHRRRRGRVGEGADPAEHWRSEDIGELLAGGEGGARTGERGCAGDVQDEEADGAGEFCGLRDWG